MQNNIKGPIFIVGNSRSGTSVMGRVLGTHSDIYTFVHEVHFFDEIIDSHGLHKEISDKEGVKIYATLLSIINEGYLVKKRNIEPYLKDAQKRISLIKKGIGNITPAEIYRNFINYFTEKNNKKIPCEQTPRYLFFIKEIFEIFPEAKVINMIRDPRDILLSQKNKWRLRFLGHSHIPLKESLRAWANYHPVVVSKIWKRAIEEIERWKNDKRVLIVRFEDLLDNPEEILKKICDFLKIEYQPQMLLVPEVGSSLDRFNPEKLGLDSTKKQRWKKGGLSTTEIYICEEINRYELLKYGYNISKTLPDVIGIFKETILLSLKITFSLGFNINRLRVFKKVMRKRRGKL